MTNHDDEPYGIPLQAVVGPDRYPLVRPATVPLSARDAAAEVLAAYLRQVVFESAAVGDSEECASGRRWKLNAVLTHWPVAGEPLNYPSASIEESPVSYLAHDFTPTALEETWDAIRGTVLWKTAEESLEFQVDFWTYTEPDRAAIEGALPVLFGFTEARSGVLLSGHPRYWRAPVRATLVDHDRINTSDDVYARERRLRATVRCDIDVIHQRAAATLTPRAVW